MARFNSAHIPALSLLNHTEWELLCDQCGICCLYKVRLAPDTHTFLTRVACRYLDLQSCTCTVYHQRHELMPTCIALTPSNISQLSWLPETCAYRRIAEGKPLPWWHQLCSGKHDLVHTLGISARGIAISEKYADLNDVPRYMIQPW